MEKEFVISSLMGLIEARRYWEELSDHIDNLGGDLWETKYVEAYNFHEELVYDLIKKYRKFSGIDEEEIEIRQDAVFCDLIKEHKGFPEVNEEEFEIFQDAIFYLSKNKEFKLFDENSNLVKSIKSGKELYDFMESEIVNYIKK